MVATRKILVDGFVRVRKSARRCWAHRRWRRSCRAPRACGPAARNAAGGAHYGLDRPPDCTDDEFGSDGGAARLRSEYRACASTAAASAVRPAIAGPEFDLAPYHVLNADQAKVAVSRIQGPLSTEPMPFAAVLKRQFALIHWFAGYATLRTRRFTARLGRCNSRCSREMSDIPGIRPRQEVTKALHGWSVSNSMFYAGL
jgi:hypothetical protein